MLDHYAQVFNTVEINSTYYRIPHPAVFWHLDQKTPKDFDFIVKTNKEITHVRKQNREFCNELIESVKPLKNSGKLKGFLAQFPYSFKLSPQNLDYVGQTNEFLGDDPFFVEFRHKSWVNDKVYNFLRQNNIGYVCVDEPQLPNLLPPQDIVTTDTGYVRMHGRNNVTWWDASKGDRYDYSYTKQEMENWKERLLKMLLEVKKLYLFFNNCHHGHAASNAIEMSNILV